MGEVDFTISIEKKDGSKGVRYFCNTQQGEGGRFILGNIRTWNSVEERDALSSYNGPDFEDLEDQLQAAMEEYLSEIGITHDVYDFIDTSATHKEHREYMRWLENFNNFVKA